MSKQRVVKDEIWDDTWFNKLSPKDKLMWLYLLTNPRCNVAGVYKMSTEFAAIATGLEKKDVDASLKLFCRDGKLKIVDEWLIIVNFLKHQKDNPSIRKGIQRILSEVPQKVTDCIQTVYSQSTVRSTLLNFTLLNLTIPNGSDVPEDLFDQKKFTDEDLRLAQLLVDLIKQNNPDWQMRGNIETWAEHIEKLRRIDKRTPVQIEYMIHWTQQHDFWASNILSTAKLRQKFNDLIPQLKRDMALKQTKRRLQTRKKFA